MNNLYRLLAGEPEKPFSAAQYEKRAYVEWLLAKFLESNGCAPGDSLATARLMLGIREYIEALYRAVKLAEDSNGL